jgi:hypothetical protein
MTTSAPHLIIAAGGTGRAHVPRAGAGRGDGAPGLAGDAVDRCAGRAVCRRLPPYRRRAAGGLGHLRAGRGAGQGAGAVPRARRCRQRDAAHAARTARRGGGLRRLPGDPGDGGGLADARAARDPRTERRAGPGEPAFRAAGRCGGLRDMAHDPALGRGRRPHRQPGPRRDPVARGRALHAARRLADEPSGLRRQPGRAGAVRRGARRRRASARGAARPTCAWRSRRGPRISTA